MTVPLSTDQGVSPVDKILTRDRVDEIDTDTDKRSAIRIDWSKPFHRDLKRINDRNMGLSRTEIEMLLADEAMKYADERIQQTNAEWVKPIEYINDVFVHGSPQYKHFEHKKNRFVDSVSGLKLTDNDEVDKILPIAHKTKKRAKQMEDDYGVTKKSRLRMGMAKVIRMNRGWFCGNTENHADEDWEQVDEWFESAEVSAEYVAQDLGNTLKRAAENDNLRKREYKAEMKTVRTEYPSLYENLAKGFGSDPIDVDC